MSQLGLGEMLQLRGWITRRQLNRALAQQRRYGGRLGTSLLEIGAVSEDQLLTVLADQGGVPRGPIDRIRELPLNLGRLIPRDLARRRRLIPVEETQDSLLVAFEDPWDLAARDEVAFATTKRIQPLGLHEVRISEGLERLYGIDCPPRIARLLKELNRSRSRTNGTAPHDDPARGGKAGSSGSSVILGRPIFTPIPRGPQPDSLKASPPPEPLERPATSGPRLKVVELTATERAELEHKLDRDALAALPVH
ncbi:MAG: hypothetical protein KDD47_28965, partial [Acidobacteria bacterium]|nr:hypothetical protein [Acidobacteriota bacterium]